MILKGVIGLVITFKVKRNGHPLDISGASTKNLIFVAPSGASQTKTGTLGSGTGELTYTTTAASDLNEAGNWKVAASIVMSGWTGQTTAAGFQVIDTI